MRVEEQVHEQRLDRRTVVADPVIAAGIAQGCVLQPVQRALASQWRAVAATRLQLASKHGQHRIMPQLVVVVQILVAKRDAEHPLADQGRHLMLDPLRRSRVLEARREPPDQADGPVRGPEQHSPGIRGDRPTVEAGDHGAALDGGKLEQRRATLCRHRGPPLRRGKALSQKTFRRFRAPMHLRLVRYAG